jgi:toxin-antitoxin system PIN domain toxin
VIALLDVNVLVALFDPAHLHHDAAHAWFESNHKGQWATCPLTENALVRVLSNPAYPGRRTAAEDAAARLRSFCSAREHVFWPDSISIRDSVQLPLESHSGSSSAHRRLPACPFSIEPGAAGDF